MSKVEYSKQLKKLSAAWKEKRDEGFEDVFKQHPVGTFVQKLIGCKLGETDAGLLYVSTSFVTLEGASKGKRYNDFQRVTKDSLYFLGIFFTRLEIEPLENLEDLPDIVEELNTSGLIVKQKISHNSYTDRDGNQQEGVNGQVLSVLEGIENEKDTEEVAEVAEVKAEEVDIDTLKNALNKYGIEFPDTEELDEIVSTVNTDYDLTTSDITNENDQQILVKAGINVEGIEGAEGVEAETEEDVEDPDLATLRLVCENNSVKFDEDDTCEDLGERLSEFEWNKDDELDKNEVTAMKKYGIKIKK